MRLHRLIAILLLLESRGRLKARELADALEVTERTIHRDIETLCEAGVPIQATAGPTGGFCLMEGYTQRIPQSHQSEVVSLFLHGIGMDPVEQREAHMDLQRTLGHLESRLPNQYRNDVQAARKRFYFDPEPWWEIPGSSHLGVLRQGVWQLRKVLLEYENADHERTQRIVRPHGLVVKTMHWYLVAFCELREEIRTFSVPRIKYANLLEETFPWPEDFSLETYWKARAKAFKTEVSTREQHLHGSIPDQ